MTHKNPLLERKETTEESETAKGSVDLTAAKLK
jgi:hypothetical protein